jgi:hypothetical protein
LPTEHMLNNASKTTKFFYRDMDSTYPFWRLKTPEEHEAETGCSRGTNGSVWYLVQRAYLLLRVCLKNSNF